MEPFTVCRALCHGIRIRMGELGLCVVFGGFLRIGPFGIGVRSGLLIMWTYIRIITVYIPQCTVCCYEDTLMHIVFIMWYIIMMIMDPQ